MLKLDPTRRRLITGGGSIEYAQLVLALGARPRAVAIDGDAADSVLRVNDLPSYRRLRATLDQGVRHVTLLGAGLIGCELADDLRAGGFAVTVVDPAARPLSRLLPTPMGALLQTRLADVGVDWRLGETLMRVDLAQQRDSDRAPDVVPDPASSVIATATVASRRSGEGSDGGQGLRYLARLASGAVIETDLVIAATGLVANLGLAEKAGLAVDQGVRVDRHMRTSLPDIYALGDCATVEGQAFSFIEPIRRQAEAIAADLRGELEPFVPMPPLIRVKTPTLPLTICGSRAALADSDAWELIETNAQGMRMEYRGADEAGAFALAGAQARPASAPGRAGGQQAYGQ